MTAGQRHFDTALALCAALTWAFAAFALGSRYVSETAATLAAAGFLVSGLAVVLSIHVRDSRLETLAAGTCPRCGADVAIDHVHRRWDATQRRWLRPVSMWECPACAYSHSEGWSCPACPSD